MTDKDEILELTYEMFDKEISQNTVSIVDFWAPWCVPCRVMAVTLLEVKKALDSKFPGKVKFYKVNVDEEPRLAQKHGVMSLPTIFGFQGIPGAPKRYTGKTKDHLENWIQGLIGG